MKDKQHIKELLESNYREFEEELDIKIRNGQAVEGIRKALNWVLR